MKFATMSKSVALGLALIVSSLAATSTFASTKGSLVISSPVMVNGTKLKAGDYKVEWEGSGPNVEVTIMSGKTVLAKVPAHVVELQTMAADDAALTRQSASGPNTLAGIRFHGQKFELDLDGGAAMADGSSK